MVTEYKPAEESQIPENLAAFANDITIDGAKALFPEMSQGPLINGIMDNGNPGIRLIQNDDNIYNMLKIVYIENYKKALFFAKALAECDTFLLNAEGKKDDVTKEVLQRVGWLKYLMALSCSVKGRFADAYKQTATGVLTNAMSEKGWTPLSMPQSRRESARDKEAKGKRG